MENWYLPNGLVYRTGTLKAQSVLIAAGRVAALGEEADRLQKGWVGPIGVFDARGCLISRGFVDLHTHLREPGFVDKETIASGTAAAAAGGFTSVCPMPNTAPPLDSTEALRALEAKIERGAVVKIHPIAALTVGRRGKTPVEYGGFVSRGVRLFSDDGDPLADEIAQEVFEKVQRAGGVLINHLEDKSLVGEGFFYGQIPPESEYIMLHRDLRLAAKTNCPYHAAHLSCRQAVDLIARAKERGLPVSAEVTPHHLTLTHRDIREPKGNFQMKPPLRGEADRQALLAGLAAGIIDFVATDHAPHGSEKEGGLSSGSPFGVTGLETAFPILYTTLVVTGQISLVRLLESMTNGPARFLGLDQELAVGAAADVVVVDLKRRRTVVKDRFKSKGTNSPYLGQTLTGWPCLTLVDGKQRYICKDNEGRLSYAD